MAEPTGMPQYPSSGPPLTPPPGPGRSAAPIAEEPTGSIEVPQSRIQTIARKTGWIFLGVFCFVFFTVAKMPRDRINDFIEGNISSVLASRGITFTAKKADLSLLFGLSYDMKDVTLNFPAPAPAAHVDEIEVSPSVLPLLLGRIGASIKILNTGGSLRLDGSMHGSHISGSFKADRFNVGDIALLRLMANIGGSAVLSGRGNFSVDTDAMTETNADIQLDLSKIVIDSQSIQGFAIPRLSMSSGKVDLSIDHGRGVLRTLRIGSPSSPTDDIRADISGDILFGKRLETSTCNLKANFSFSPALLKSFSLVSALLAAGRQPDGSFSYRLAGPLLSPNPIPAGGH